MGRVPCQDWDRPDGERRGVTATRTNNPGALARAPKDIFFAHFFNGAAVPREFLEREFSVRKMGGDHIRTKDLGKKDRQ